MAKTITKKRPVNKKTSKAKKGKPLVASSSTKKNLRSAFIYLGLLIGAALLGLGLFFLTHPLDQYEFHNPFKVFKHTVSQLIKKVDYKSKPTENYSINYDEYKYLSENISLDNKARIVAFLEENPNSPLSKTLRNKWLIFLASKGKWKDFLYSYKPTNNQEVECYYLQGLYYSGKETLALSGVKRLWMAGYKTSPACNFLFKKWQNSDDFKEEYFWPRIQTAIDTNDLTSLNHLQNTLPSEKKNWIVTWLAIRKNPSLLPAAILPDNEVGQRIALDGFKQWASINIDHAIQYWNTSQQKYHFDEAATQDFYLTASLHLALNGDPRAEIWFGKILPQYSTSQSRTWQVRFALMHQNWANVLSRINTMPPNEQTTNMWQYWKARALVKLGNNAEANKIYAHLSTQRQYYGFLSAYQQRKALAIQQKNYPQNSTLLTPYAQQIAQIKQLYETQKISQALQLTQDLLNQLDNIGQYTLANLLAEWGWYSEAMMITNRSPYQSDLKLRFPMPYRVLITQLSREANISPALVYAIARQESNFHENVFSSAGGLGILQLTLATAQQFEPKVTQKDLYNPRINIKISITYLKRLTRQFNKHPLLIASAYNAGPQKTRSWQPIQKAMPADIWIEIRPWEETRNYMKNILSYDAVYQYLLGHQPNIDQFMQDIPANS